MARVGINNDTLDLDRDVYSASFSGGGNIISASQSFVTINSIAVLDTTSTVQDHNDTLGINTPPGTASHTGVTMNNAIKVQSYVTINGNPIVVTNSRASCYVAGQEGYEHKLSNPSGPSFINIQV